MLQEKIKEIGKLNEQMKLQETRCGALESEVMILKSNVSCLQQATRAIILIAGIPKQPGENSEKGCRGGEHKH